MTAQAAFHAALLDVACPVPEGLCDGSGRPAGRRYGVYRNNVAVSLRDALDTGFPATARLLGAENFAHVAGRFLRSAPPTTPVMMHYGTGFPAFLEGLAPLAHLPYLGDVARIELALRASYHAADSPVADATILQGLDETAFFEARLVLAPSVRLLRSPWPALAIWTYTLRPNSPKPLAGAQDTLILRPDFDPEPHLLPDGGFAFLEGLDRGHCLGAAMDQAGEGFDPGPTLGLLLAGGGISFIHPPKE